MKKLFVATAVSAALIAGPAAAEMYVGIGAGASKTNTNENSWKLFGGYQFNPTWGAELAYTDLGSYRSADIEAWSLAGTATLPLAERWALIGKLGATSNRPHFAGSSNHSDLLVGLGVGYSLTKNVGVRLEYEDFGKLSKNGIGNDSKGSNLGLSLKYGF